jgi:succinate dehydrogenase / fumarate reductase cytochrome b subunit
MAERPLSPFLSVYKFKYTLVTSILNRLAGLLLSLGLLVLVYWLVALAGGARSYTQARNLLSLGVFKLVYLLLLAAFIYHLLAGMRHLVWDCGIGLERAAARRSAWIVGLLSIVLTVLVACWLFRVGLSSR